VATLNLKAALDQLIPFRLPPFASRLAARALALDEASDTYETLRAMPGPEPLTHKLLRLLNVTCAVEPVSLRNIPRSGALLIVANHPFGILESAVLAQLIGERRSDVKFLANGILTLIPELASTVIPVDPGCQTQSSASGMRAALRHLEQGGALVVFPAGEVAHLRGANVREGDWNPAIARLARLAARSTELNVVPIHVAGRNSALFQAAGLIHPAARTALLARELLNKRNAQVEVRIGKAIGSAKLAGFASHNQCIAYLRWRTHLLASRQTFKPQTRRPLLGRTARAPQSEPIAEPTPPEAIAAEIAALPAEARLAESNGLQVYLVHGPSLPATMREIARLREITFRAEGEGTGRALDTDRFDAHYLQLFLWNPERREIAGGYRLAGTDVVRPIYTGTLFHYHPSFLRAIGPALELGRSFVRQEYQKGFTPLLLLWKGIGKYVACNPRYRVLFGPVSISNQYQAMSRELIISYLERHAQLDSLISAVRPRHAPRRLDAWGGACQTREACQTGEACQSLDDLSGILADVDPAKPGVPVLLRQYLKLGGRLLGFNVDPEFAGALDGLILVDLMRTGRPLLERYLGKQEAAQFLNYQEKHHGPFQDLQPR